VPLYAVVEFVYNNSSTTNNTIVGGTNCQQDSSVFAGTLNTTGYYYCNKSGTLSYFSLAPGACQAGMQGQIVVGAAQNRVYTVQVAPNSTPTYSPANLTIWQNSSVQFSFPNSSSTAYTVTQGSNCNVPSGTSPLFNINVTSQVIFQNVGTYPYFSLSPGDCANGMQGTITVVPPNFDVYGDFVNTTATGQSIDTAMAFGGTGGGGGGQIVETSESTLVASIQGIFESTFGAPLDSTLFGAVYFI